MVDCFKAGLKPEIEQRLGEAANVNDVVKDAIKVERILAARRSLRKPGVSNEIKQDKKRIYICQICNQSGHETNNCNVIPTCSICNKAGHSADKCLLLKTKNEKIEFCKICQKSGHSTSQCNKTITCQLCNRVGHTAVQCYKIAICQVCNKQGHIANFCRSQTNSPSVVCQLCSTSGHSADKCFQLNQKQPSFANSENKLICQLCHNSGHTAATCKITVTCTYCQNKGHTVNQCKKRIYNEQTKSGNGQSPLATNAAQGTPKLTQRSAYSTQVDDLKEELTALQFDLRLD